MKILNADNKIMDTDLISNKAEFYYSVLSFRDYKNPDFFFERNKGSDIVEMESASIALRIGNFSLVMPIIWSIIVTDNENLECVPLYEAQPRNLNVFLLNPVNGFISRFHPLQSGMIYPVSNWSMPNLKEKEMLVVPLGHDPMHRRMDREGNPLEVGPVCAIFSPTKMDISKAIADIW